VGLVFRVFRCLRHAATLPLGEAAVVYHHPLHVDTY
jgi:hypothetical protein